MTTVPFLIEDSWVGLAQCHGLLKEEGDSLVIEHQTQDAVAGVLKSEIAETRVPLTSVASIRLERRWWGLSNTLVVQFNSMKDAPAVLGMKQGKLVLPIARRDAPSAQALVQSVATFLDKCSSAPLRA